MSAHTPGPWSFEHVYGTCYTVQCAGKQYHIGTVRGKQNARLIAAAPDLLDALKPFAVYGRPGSKDTEVGAAIAAIAKATGAAA